MTGLNAEEKEITTQEAVLQLRRDPKFQELIRDSYLGDEVFESAERFFHSAEFIAVLNLLGDFSGKAILDFGSGIGIAAASFARKGAEKVVALDPDRGDQIGLQAARKLSAKWLFQLTAAMGESLPFAAESFDIVYSRQVLHHAGNLPKMAGELYRALRRGGILLSTRDHVIDNQRQLNSFLAEHPVHQLAGGENAFRLLQYLEALTGAGFEIKEVFGPWDSVINAFPIVRSQSELDALPQLLLQRVFGRLGRLMSKIPGIAPMIWLYLRRRRKPGRMYSFLAVKPC